MALRVVSAAVMEADVVRGGGTMVGGARIGTETGKLADEVDVEVGGVDRGLGVEDETGMDPAVACLVARPELEDLGLPGPFPFLLFLSLIHI